MGGGVLGMRVTGSVPVTLSKLEAGKIAPPDPASAAMIPAVLDDVRHKTLTPGRYAPAAIKRLQPTLAQPPPAGAPQSINYLGRIHVRWRSDQPETIQDVFKVQASGGIALCRIALGEGGLVTDFECHTVEP
jgi:hypothetical protein